MANTSFIDFLGKTVQDFIALLLDGKVTNLVLKIIFVFVAFIWIYCGVKIFLDVRSRFNTSIFVKILFLIFGVIAGPIGLILYIITRPKHTPDELDFLKIEHKFYFQQAATVLDCMYCGGYILSGQTFCTNCGKQNRFHCEVCNTLTDYDDKYCHACGASFEKRIEEILENIDKDAASARQKQKSIGLLGSFFFVGTSLRSFWLAFKSNAIKLLDFGGNLKETLSKKGSEDFEDRRRGLKTLSLRRKRNLTVSSQSSSLTQPKQEVILDTQSDDQGSLKGQFESHKASKAKKDKKHKQNIL